MSELALITPTSDRPVAFSLCERWMERALEYYGRPVSWFVIDDGLQPVRCHLGQMHVRFPHKKDRLSSFTTNLLAGLEMIEAEKLLFIEDDDWYAPNYLAAYSARLDDCCLTGESLAKSYSPLKRRYWVWGNENHSSLCQTGIRGDLVPWAIDIIKRAGTPFVDLHLWNHGRNLFPFDLRPESLLCVGMKGLPGTGGFTDGHNGHPFLGGNDLSGDVLRSWIGVEDAEVYLEMKCDVWPSDD